MISARSGRTELTDILLTGDNIDTDIQENVRMYSCCVIEIGSETHTKYVTCRNNLNVH